VEKGDSRSLDSISPRCFQLQPPAQNTERRDAECDLRDGFRGRTSDNIVTNSDGRVRRSCHKFNVDNILSWE